MAASCVLPKVCDFGRIFWLKSAKMGTFLRFARPCTCSAARSFSSRPVGADRPEAVIYRGPISGQIRLVKMFSLSSSVAGLALQPYLYHHASTAGIGVAMALGGVVGFFTFVTPLLLHWITKKYVHVMTYKESSGTYTANVLTFFMRNRKISFQRDDVTIPEIPGMFTTFVAKGQPLFVDSRAFEDLDHYGRLMGYDKPIDLKLGTPDKKM